jgi:hypothetical protein
MHAPYTQGSSGNARPTTAGGSPRALRQGELRLTKPVSTQPGTELGEDLVSALEDRADQRAGRPTFLHQYSLTGKGETLSLVYHARVGRINLKIDGTISLASGPEKSS